MENNITINNRIPQLRFPGYTGDWEEKSLGEVGVFVRGLSYNKGEVTQDRAATLVLRSNNIIQDGVVDCRNGLQFVTKEPSSEQILQKGDIVICLSNGSSNLVGKSANYEGDYAGIATVGAFCGIYRSTAPITKYLVQTPAYKKSVELIKQGGNGALANLYGRDILGLKFYFPTLEEQNEIVECLEAEDRMIAAQEQKVESLKTHKKGLMQQLFPQPGATTPALRFPGFSGNWEKKKFKDITVTAGKKNRQNIPYERYSISNEDGFYPQSSQFEDGGGYLKDIDCRQYIIVPPKSFAYNPARINVGSIGYQDLGKDVIVSSLYEVFQTKDGIDDAFLWQWFHTDIFRRMVINVQEGGVRQYFFYEKLRECSINLPTLSEQKIIAACLEAEDQMIAAQEQKVESLKIHKKGLMQQLFPQPVK